MYKEFKEFILRGNVLDMAIGVIIGIAFGNIISSLVNDIFMPVLSKITSGVNLATLKYVLTPEEIGVCGEVLAEESAILYGLFIQNIIDFLLIAISIFFFIKLVSKIRKPEEEVEENAAPTQEELLTEIRDLLKK
ncbi:MAG: large-conductance mechanosensitive channel protein MscL [Synergistaceae bacterium]|jgi:large conductance mechanosensitive channel|nr:large-conductance mechanosensitive channel protein MscL [Synergistaceae bacterium]